MARVTIGKIFNIGVDVDAELNDDFLESLKGEFIDSAIESVAQLQELCASLKEGDYNIEMLKEIFRVFHTLKGSAAIVGCLDVRNLTHYAETVLDKVT
ncbi:MAG: Hpt domain-containing protein, partial [Lentisphaeraceae bacterium]|nr:Hpt domain-containing protein [Lentisphaeraceae bacterium]